MIQLRQTAILDESLFQIKWEDYAKPVAAIHCHLEKSNNEMTGWLNSPLENNEDMLNLIHQTATTIKKLADVLVVIGIGGSFLGAKAIQEALKPYFSNIEEGIEVVYVGQNMSGAYIRQLLDSLDKKEVFVNVISKSGTTMETALAFRVMRHFMEKKYGEESHKRIIVTTDADHGILKEIAKNAGYQQFKIPSNIGGRFSVLTPVGLLPIAVAGVDIEKLLEGAKKAATVLKNDSLEQNEAYRYAVIRQALYKQGYQIELLASFEPALAVLHEWWKQLFGESEGKGKKGLFPAAVNYSTDLHALGQFIQNGSPIIIETLLHFKEISCDYEIPFDFRNYDRLNNVANFSFNEINAISKEGTVMAHAEGGVPIIQIELERLDAYHLGYLIYFFMKACAMSAYLMEVNPFDQPDVEEYKQKITKLLKEKNLKVQYKVGT